VHVVDGDLESFPYWKGLAASKIINKSELERLERLENM